MEMRGVIWAIFVEADALTDPFIKFCFRLMIRFRKSGKTNVFYASELNLCSLFFLYSDV